MTAKTLVWKNDKATLEHLNLAVTMRKRRAHGLNHLWMVTTPGQSLLDPDIKEQVILECGFATTKRSAKKSAESAARARMETIR